MIEKTDSAEKGFLFDLEKGKIREIQLPAKLNLAADRGIAILTERINEENIEHYTNSNQY